MTLDEAIRVLRQHNEKGASVLKITRGQALEKDLLAQVLDSCEQLISEKAEYKRLLKAAVEDFSNMNYHIFDCDGMCDTCPIHGNRDECNKWCNKWVRANEALKLIGDESSD